MGVIWFVYIVYDAYVREIKFIGWVENTGASWSSLEWVQPSPPMSHTYNELPFVYSCFPLRRGGNTLIPTHYSEIKV